MWTTAAINDREQQRYDSIYAPANEAAIKSSTSTALVDDARQEITDAAALNSESARSLREMRRFGLNGPSAIQTDVANKAMGLRTAASNVGLINNANMNQYERNENFGTELVNVGKGYAEDGRAGLRAADSADTQRGNANRANKAAASAEKKQAVASAAMIAMMFM